MKKSNEFEIPILTNNIQQCLLYKHLFYMYPCGYTVYATVYDRLLLGESIEVEVKTRTMKTAPTLKALKDENKHKHQRAEEPLKPLSLTKSFSGAVAS